MPGIRLSPKSLLVGLLAFSNLLVILKRFGKKIVIYLGRNCPTIKQGKPGMYAQEKRKASTEITRFASQERTGLWFLSRWPVETNSFEARNARILADAEGARWAKVGRADGRILLPEQKL